LFMTPVGYITFFALPDWTLAPAPRAQVL